MPGNFRGVCPKIGRLRETVCGVDRCAWKTGAKKIIFSPYELDFEVLIKEEHIVWQHKKK